MSKSFELKYRIGFAHRLERLVFECDPASAEASARERAKEIRQSTGVVDFKLYWPDYSTTQIVLNETVQLR